MDSLMLAVPVGILQTTITWITTDTEEKTDDYEPGLKL